MAVDALSMQTLLPAMTGTPAPGAAAGAAPAAAGGGFTESLNKMLTAVDETAGTANTAVADMLTGKGDVHTAMIALQRAEMTLQLTVQIRNKLVTAYQDVMRMPI
jgi:flagellar hook-basal body complex protein FliE